MIARSVVFSFLRVRVSNAQSPLDIFDEAGPDDFQYLDEEEDVDDDDDDDDDGDEEVDDYSEEANGDSQKAEETPLFEKATSRQQQGSGVESTSASDRQASERLSKLESLVERSSGVSLEEVEDLYPFTLDDFQRDATVAILN
ncbi:hypothetical protein CYMTET_47872, partial [Cymbomonas tetramitiformis]